MIGMISRWRRLLVLVVAICCLVPQIASSAENRCERHLLAVKPSWISSAAVISGSGNLCVSDPTPGARRLLLYDSNLEFQREIASWRDLALTPHQEGDAFSPLTFESSANNLLRLSLLGYEPIWIDSDFRVLSNLRRTEASATARLPTTEPVAIYYSNAQLTPTNRLVGYGAIVENLNASDERLQLGFIGAKSTITQAPPHDPIMLLPLVDNTYYLFGYPYVASNRTGTFAVAMDKAGARLYRLDPNAGSTRNHTLLPGLIPKDFAEVAEIDKGRGGSAEELSVLTQFRFSKAVAGLYGNKRDQIFILTREPVAGSTIWRMHEVDPDRRALGPPLVLPTQADQLTIAPGESFWYIFERHDTGLNEQDIATALKLPADWFEDSRESPLLAEMPTPDCVVRHH